MNGCVQTTISISTVNVGAYMIGELDVLWKNIYEERYKICEKIIKKCLNNKIDIICTQEDILLSESIKEDEPCETEFYELYGKYGYIVISQCILHNNTSETLQKLHPTYHIKIGNVIYVHKSQVYNILPVPQIYPNTKCVAYCMIYGYLKLANVHLCGGRFDDQIVFQDDTTYTDKLKQIRSIDNSSIICGDFNSTRSYGKPGGLKNWDYPTFLAKSAIFRSVSPTKKKNNSPSNYVLTIDEKMKWETWQCSPIEYLYFNPKVHYKSVIQDEELKKIGETTSRGNYVVDWIFYDAININCIESKIIKLYGESVSPISDHHMVFSKFLIQN